MCLETPHLRAIPIMFPPLPRIKYLDGDFETSFEGRVVEDTAKGLERSPVFEVEYSNVAGTNRTGLGFRVTFRKTAPFGNVFCELCDDAHYVCLGSFLDSAEHIFPFGDVSKSSERI